MFIDVVHIFARGGNGGNGCVSFRREAHVPKGGPDGGDGGRGGSIYLCADSSISSLIDYRFSHHFKANRGMHGQGSKRSGKNGEDVVLKVPIGTIVKEYDSQSGNVGSIIADLNENGMQCLIARGGHGGLGNTHFVTPTHRAPSFCELGEPGQEVEVELELKLLADCALIGMPSVGKSSLISVMSRAKPKIADYPFTTLVPNLGVAKVGQKSFVIADVPGLIEGASCGRGLGTKFLRHIERASIIVHVIDITGGMEKRNPLLDYEIITNELREYNIDLSKRPRLIVANKVDVAKYDEVAKNNLEALRQKVESDFNKLLDDEGNKILQTPKLIEVSAVTKEGIEQLKRSILEVVEANRSKVANEKRASKTYDATYTYSNNRDADFEIFREDGAWRVVGDAVLRSVVQTNWENEEAVDHFQKRFKKMGVEEKLFSKGAKNGDEIRIGDISFDLYSTNEANKLKIGIFGGSFDPVHLGHIACAQSAKEACNLDKVIFVPTHISPFKNRDSVKVMFSDDERLSLLNCALENYPDFSVCDFEIEKQGISYTYETLNYFYSDYKKRGIEASLYLIIGSDLVCELDLWKNAIRISHLARVICIMRPGFLKQSVPKSVSDFHFRIEFVKSPGIDVSSHEIKQKLLCGEDVSPFVPANTLDMLYKFNDLSRG